MNHDQHVDHTLDHAAKTPTDGQEPPPQARRTSHHEIIARAAMGKQAWSSIRSGRIIAHNRLIGLAEAVAMIHRVRPHANTTQRCLVFVERCRRCSTTDRRVRLGRSATPSCDATILEFLDVCRVLGLDLGMAIRDWDQRSQLTAIPGPAQYGVPNAFWMDKAPEICSACIEAAHLPALLAAIKVWPSTDDAEFVSDLIDPRLSSLFAACLCARLDTEAPICAAISKIVKKFAR